MADAMYSPYRYSPSGAAGASAQAIYDRRSRAERRRAAAALAFDAKWRSTVKASHPIRGRLASALVPRPAAAVESPATEAWARGAAGERSVAEVLDGCPEVIALHDRALPGSRANIDHVVVGRPGVFVVDTKAYRTWVGIGGSRWGWGEEELLVAGHPRPDLVEGVTRQAEAVVHALTADGAALADTAVTPVLCFTGSQWRFSPPFRVGPVLVASPATLARVVGGLGPFSSGHISQLADRLTEALPPRVTSARVV